MAQDKKSPSKEAPSLIAKSDQEPEYADRGIAEGHSIAGQLLTDDEMVTEALEQSFPASDPPSYMAHARAGAPHR